MKPLTAPADAERVVVDYLTAAMVARSRDVTVGVDVPATWIKGTKSHVQVGMDGTPEVIYPILSRASVRVTCWDTSTTVAKALASLCLAILCSHPGDAAVGNVRPLTGVLPVRDPDTGAELASVSVQVNLLHTVIA